MSDTDQRTDALAQQPTSSREHADASADPTTMVGTDASDPDTDHERRKKEEDVAAQLGDFA